MEMTPILNHKPNQKENTMKTTHILIGLMAVGSLAMAGNVTIPNTFTAGTAAKASEVNANFSAVKTAVDGNANDIATNSHDIDGKLTKSITECAAGSSIRKINTDGTVVCEDDTDTDTTYTVGAGLSMNGTIIKRANGSVTIDNHFLQRAFDNASGSCNLIHGPTYSFFASDSTASNCEAFAPVTLPDGSTIKSITCWMYKNAGTQSMYVHLKKREISAQATVSTITSLFISGDGTLPQPFGPVYVNEDVNNSTSSYFLDYLPKETDSASNNKRFYSCTINYEF
jgi:hypothetical protein